MNIDYLRYFLDVVDTKSITKAARLNFISPQGMSRAMGELERELDCKLLERYPNRLGLTNQCGQLVPAVEKVVAAYDEFMADVDKLHTAETDDAAAAGTIRLLCQPICSFCFFPDEIMDLLLSNDAIQCLEEGNSAIFAELEKGHDAETGRLSPGTMGVTRMFDTKQSNTRRSIRELEAIGYKYRPFLTSYDVAMVHADSPLAAKEVLEDDDILSQPIITSSGELHEITSQLFGKKAIAMTSSDVSLRRRAVESGDYLTFMPAICKLNWSEKTNAVLKPFASSYGLELGFIGTKDDFEGEQFGWLVGKLLDWYSQHEDPSLFTIVWK